MNEKKEYHVVSHTHWDREWYQSFEEMRLRLLDLVDDLLEIFEEYPDYIFHMDAQIVCLEDYLEIRPYRKKIIEKHIAEGRLQVGPWYVQNDFNLCSGEATVRNLLIGSTMAEEWGGTQRVGYAPDQFGLIGQLPQIYSNFDIKHSLSGRGYRFYKRAEDGSLEQVQMPVEFDWIGVDGTLINSYNMACWYNNAQRFPSEAEKAYKYFKLVAETMEPLSSSPVKLLMNGVDHLQAQEDLLPVLEGIQEQAGDTVLLKQSSMIECLEKIAESLKGSDKPSIKGELRHGTTNLVLSGTLSSRPYLKLLNMECQNRLELELEPLYARLNDLTDAAVEYPADMLNYLWKELQKNHAHDSICGCSNDRVHQDNENRFMRVLDAANDLKRRGMDHLVQRISREGMDDDGYLIAVLNTLPYERVETVEMLLTPIVEDGFTSFELLDEEGNLVEFDLLDSVEENLEQITPCNLMGQRMVNKHRIRFQVAMPASAYRTFTLVRSDNQVNLGVAAGGARCLWNKGVAENEYLRVTVAPDGQLSILDIETGEEYEKLLSFENLADIGESYWYAPDPDAEPFDCSSAPEITMHKDKLVLNYDFAVTLTLSLDKRSRELDIETVIDNKGSNHRLRMLIHTGVESDVCLSSQPFDCLERSSVHEFPDLRDDWTEPNNGMVSVRNEERQLTVFNNGIYEYEQLNDGQGTIALTLLRSTARIANDPVGQGDPAPIWNVPENQCLREISYKLAVRPGKLDQAGLLREMQCFHVPLLTVFDAVDSRKLQSGRPYVADSELQRWCYRLPKPEEPKLPLSAKGIELDQGMVFSALKESYDRKSKVLRFYNPTEKAIITKLDIDAQESMMDERRGGAKWSVGNSIGPKKVVTLRYGK